MRIQAENVSRVHSIYVVDDENRLKGRLSLKDLLTTSTKNKYQRYLHSKIKPVNVIPKMLRWSNHAEIMIRLFLLDEMGV
jgi:Mg/Co/Ni transporter MgtE